MTNKDCPPSSLWDNLVSACVPSEMDSRPEHGPVTEPTLAVVVQQRSTAHSAQVNPVMALNPALVIFAMLAILGSMLALALWFIIYRRQTSLRNTSEDSEPQQAPLQKTEPRAIIHSLAPERNSHADMLQGAGGAPSPCSRLHLRAQIDSQWEEGFATCSGTAEHAGTEGLRGPPTCNTMREPRIPLPATELGGTALVTTKTM